MSRKSENLDRATQSHLNKIVDVLRSEFEQVTGFATGKKKHSQILKIILFGSRASGKGVFNPISGYVSDYDILIILNRRDLIDHKLWYVAEERLAVDVTIPVNCIVHTLSEVNNELAKGNYFFRDISEEGILLYESDNKSLFTPKALSSNEYKKIANDHFQRWFPSANSFLIDFEHCMEREDFNKAAFELHQATERYYSCLLLVLTNYKPHTHNLKHLNSICIEQDTRIATVFPQTKKADRRVFQLLKKAYIDARYSQAYIITSEQLAWLFERVQLLRNLTELICTERINTI